MEVSAFITHKEVFGRDITAEELDAYAEQLSLNDCLQSIGKLSYLLARKTTHDANLLVLGGLLFPGSRMLAEGMLRVGRPILFSKRLLTAARVALLHAVDRAPDGFDEGRDLYRFVELIFGVADVYDPSGEPSGLTSVDEQKEWFASFRLKRAGLPQRSLQASIVRSIRVFVDLPNLRPELVAGESPSSAFEREVGLGLERYLAICFGIVIRFANWNQEADAWLLDAAYWRNSKVDPEEFKRAVSTLAASVGELRGAIQKEMEKGYKSIDDIRPFMIHPLVEIEEDVYVALDVETLGDALLGDGLFWRLKPDPGASDAEKNLFGSELGTLLEAHCVEVAKAVYQPHEQNSRLFPEVGYKKTQDGGVLKQDGPDLAIFEGECAAFVEIGINRPSVLQTIIRGDLTSFDNDVKKIILHRVEQLDRKFNDFLNGDLSYTGVDPKNFPKFHPVVCLLDGFPLGVPLYERIVGAIASAGYLQQAETQSLSIISVEELEQLCALVEDGEKLTEVLAAHSASKMSQESLRDYLIEEKGISTKVPKMLAEEFEKIGDRLAMQLFGTTLKREDSARESG